MPDRSVYLLETGLADLPGLAPRTPGASFPFWGTALLFDFPCALLRPLAPDACWALADTRDRAALLSAAARWGKGAIRARDAESGLAELRRLVAADKATQVFVSSTAYAAYLEPEALAGLSGRAAARRLRAESSPLPAYVFDRDRLLAEIDGAMAADPTGGATLRTFLHDHLPATVREQLDLPGRAFFVDGLMQLWDAQHFLRENIGGAKVARYIEALSGVAAPSAEAHVTESGSVKDSLVASGAVIEGSVTDSVIFPGVVIRRGAQVHQCVVMTGNRIAADAIVSNTLILPWQQEVGGESETVGPGAEIGDSRNVLQTRNEDYPRQITRGVTLIAMNASVPGKVAVGPGCYVGPGTAATLRSLKRLDRGASVR